MQRLDRFIDWFIPPHMHADRESIQRARMFLVSHLLGPVFGNAVPVGLLIAGFPRDYRIWIFFAWITSFWAVPLLLRRFGNYPALALGSIQNLIFVILWASYCYGGINSPFLPWLLTVPLLAFFYMSWSRLLRGLLLGLIALNLGTLYLLDGLGHAFPPVELEKLQAVGLVSTLSCGTYIAFIALYYAKVLSAQARLEREVRQHIETTTALRRIAGDAERAGAAKSDFVAQMGKELRTPLDSVVGYSEMLLEEAREEADEAAVRDLEKIRAAGKQLLAMVNDVLDFSNADAGRIELAVDEVDIGRCLTEVVEAHMPLIEANGNRIELQLPKQAGTMRTDRRLVSRIVGHLLENAAKFTHEGHIRIAASRSDAGGADRLWVEVADNGRGIPASRMDSLFDVFGGEAPSLGRYGGTGLGLPLCHKLCTLLGGELQVTSTVGVGTRFTVLLPALASDAAEEAGLPDTMAA